MEQSSGVFGVFVRSATLTTQKIQQQKLSMFKQECPVAVFVKKNQGEIRIGIRLAERVYLIEMGGKTQLLFIESEWELRSSVMTKPIQIGKTKPTVLSLEIFVPNTNYPLSAMIVQSWSSLTPISGNPIEQWFQRPVIEHLPLLGSVFLGSPKGELVPA
jgi:hypothetical protein